MANSEATATPTHRQAIVTKYHGPTNSNGSRIRAKCSAGSLTIPYDHALNIDQLHARAAQALADKLGWGGRWVGGTAPDESMVWVDAPIPSEIVHAVDASSRLHRFVAIWIEGGRIPCTTPDDAANLRVTADVLESIARQAEGGAS